MEPTGGQGEGEGGEGEGAWGGDAWTVWADSGLAKTPVLQHDLLLQNVVDSLFTLPAVPSATSMSGTVEVFDSIPTSRLDEADWLAPIAAETALSSQLLDAWQQPSSVKETTFAPAQGGSSLEGPIGLVPAEPARDATQRVRQAAEQRGARTHRTLDEAMQKLLTEWEQF